MSTGSRTLSLYLQIKWFYTKEQFKFFPQYLDPWFLLLDFFYVVWGFFSNPYRACRKFFDRLGKPHLGIYGETPFSVWNLLRKELKLSKNDTVFELGSGRGKGCFWLSRMTGCRTIGIERYPAFFYGSMFLKKILFAEKTQFLKQDFFQADLSSATVIYFYSTCLSDAELLLMGKRMMSVSKGVRVISVSRSFMEMYSEKFSLQKTLHVRFPWGMTKVFIQIVK